MSCKSDDFSFSVLEQQCSARFLLSLMSFPSLFWKYFQMLWLFIHESYLFIHLFLCFYPCSSCTISVYECSFSVGISFGFIRHGLPYGLLHLRDSFLLCNIILCISSGSSKKTRCKRCFPSYDAKQRKKIQKQRYMEKHVHNTNWRTVEILSFA